MLPSRLPLTFVLTVMPLTAVLFLATMSTPAYASCAMETDEAIASKGTVFVATAIEQGDRYARVQVEEVWRGPDLAPSVWLQTSSADVPPWPLRLVTRSATSVDAQLVPGTRYLIATEDDGFQVSSCVVAEVSEPFVDRLRPEATRRPVVAGATGATAATGVERSILDGTTGITLALGLLASLCLVAWFVYRRFGAGARTRGS